MENKEIFENPAEEITEDNFSEEELSEEELLKDYIDIYDVSDLEVKPAWQRQKEEWYSHLNVTVKQLDTIITLGIAGLVLVFIIIGLDAAGIF